MDGWGGEEEGEPEWVEDVIEIVDKDRGGHELGIGIRKKLEVGMPFGVELGLELEMN